MVFGFNTDIRCGDVVYHVQSELRQAEQVLQSQVFVLGCCLGKYQASFSAEAAADGFSESTAHELLKAQHRRVLDAIRQGSLEALLGKRSEIRDAGAPLEAVPPGSDGPIRLEFLHSRVFAGENKMALRFRVAAGSRMVAGATVVARLDAPGHASTFSRGETDADGVAELCLALDPASLPDTILVAQATYDGKSAAQKFRLRRK
jgi:hypothetical protein